MSQFVDGNTKSLTASAAIAAYLRVKLTSSGVAVAGATERAIGTLLNATFAALDPATVALASKAGTLKAVASGAITIGTDVYGAASGKVSATNNGNLFGVAMEAASADGDVIEVMPATHGAVVFPGEAHTADDTLTAAESGSIHTTVGASGTVVLTLPAATVGLHYYFKVGAAQELRIDPNGTETIALPSTGVQGAAGKYLTANAAGETVFLMCDTAGTWSCYGFTGTWTAES